MVNRLTGNYDAVLELAPRGVDRLLAAIHRKGDKGESAPDGPHLPHSVWFNLPFGDAPIADRNLRGHLQAQVSTPSVRVPEGPDSTRVTFSTELFCWFQPAPGSDPAPEFLHGTLSITVTVSLRECSGETLASIGIGSNDVQVSFEPAPGSNPDPADAPLAEAVAREVLARGFAPVQLQIGDLESDAVPLVDLDFKTMRRGSRSALALMLALDAESGPRNPSDVQEVFLASGEDVALALRGPFLIALIRKLAAGPLGDIRVSGSRFTVDFEAGVNPASLELELLPGRIQARIDGSGTTDIGSFRFRLTQSFGLRVVAGRLRLTLEGDPDIAITSGGAVVRTVLSIFKGSVENAVEKAAAKILPDASAELNRAVDETTGALLDKLAVTRAEFDFSRVRITPEAVDIGGAFDTGTPPPVVASFTEVAKTGSAASPQTALPFLGKQFSSYASWIPGGTIERYRWKEVTGFGGVLRKFDERHRFVARTAPPFASATETASVDAGFTSGGRPGGPSLELPGSFLSAELSWPPSVWCVEVHGKQIVSGREPVPVVGTRCGMSVVVATLDLPGSELLTLRIPDGRGGVLADVNPWGGLRGHALAKEKGDRGVLLVHHPGVEGAESAARILREALLEPGAGGQVILPTLICPDPAQEQVLAGAQDLACTHDPLGAWRKRFRLEQPGSTVLVGPGGRELWRDAGPLEGEVLAKVLAGLPSKQPRLPRRHQVSLGVTTGTLAPELPFRCAEDLVLSTGEFRDREVVLCFWASWSEPSVEELRRIAATPPAPGPSGKPPLVLCVNDGEDPEKARSVLFEIDPKAKLVTDPDRRITRRYGISVWPTVVTIDGRGRVAGARFGLDHEAPDASPRPEGPPSRGEPCYEIEPKAEHAVHR